MCTLVMFMERHCTVGSTSSLPSFEWYASHVQHTELNQLYKWNAGCSLVVEHSMSTHEPASFELISSFPNIGTSIHPVKINRAMTDFKSCASNMAYVSLCPVLMPDMQTRVRLLANSIKFIKKQKFVEIGLFEACKSDPEGLQPRTGQKVLRNNVST